MPAAVPPLTAVTLFVEPLAAEFVTTIGLPRTMVASRLFPLESSHTLAIAS